ncbi:S-layer homology domain-containing protein [Anaerotignum lactatifermentans]|uniref:S-layer homology domain-containing protein n=1 Tax=Anaerotignum lactatifermentans TaxID=160404 RepID=UPI0027B90209|nr:S-layer homology domain-containing protein [Anaerotignum lactatifermentans]
MRNKVKRTLSFLLTFVMLCSLLPMTAVAKELQPGEVAASKTASYDAENHEVTITMTVEGKEASQITPSKADVVLVVDNSGSMASSVGEPCETPKAQFENVDLLGLVKQCPECGARYWNGPLFGYVPDICEGETGSEPRIDTAQKVGKAFADSILSGENDNQMAVIGFAHGESGWFGSTDAIRKELDLTDSVTDVKNTLDAMVADGGTDYTSALQEAYDMLQDRGTTDRPGYVVFISDGAPGKQGNSIGDSNWDGSGQAEAIKDAGYDLYTIGIALDDEADDYLESLASDNHYQNVTGTNYASELEEILKVWAEEINTVPAGTDVVLVDNISDKFTLKEDQNVTGLTFDYANNRVTWNVGEITEEGKTVSFVVIPKDGVYGDNIPTNAEAKLTYTDVNGESQTLNVANATVNIPAPVAETVTLTYDANGGTGAPETATVNKNTEDYVLNTDTTPTHEPVDGRDVEFKGWSADEAVINQVYEKDNVPATVTTIDIAEENVTVYAVWAYKEEPPVGTVMLNYDANGGTGAPASTTVNKNTEVTLDSTTTPTHAEANGKYVTFAGWSNDEAVKGVIYEKGSEPTPVDKVTVGETDVTVYAVWVYGDPVDPVDPPEPPTWDHSKDKTATELDNHFNSRVTLSLPSAEKELVSDVVFVLDKSSCKKDVTNNALEMLADLGASVKDTGASIKVGAVQFAGRAVVSCELTELTDEAIAEGGAIHNGLKTQATSGGTNLQAGLLEAQKMLEADKDVEDSRKYVIVITDGLTRQFLAEDGTQDGTLMAIYNGLDADGGRVWGSPSGWCVANGFVDGVYGIPGGDWDTYYAAVKANVAKDGNTYAHDYDVYGSTPEGENIPVPYVPQGETSLTHALCLDRAIYEADKVYSELEAANYHCYAVFADDSTTNELGKAFVEYLNDGSVLDFDMIQNDIYYLLDAGSQVVDIIGQGKDDKGNDYNFDVVNLENMTITVGGVELNKVKIQSDEFPGSTTYGFFEGEIADGKYDFVVTYYPDGVADADGETREHFVWSINVPVGNFAPAQFSYDVHLTNPQKAKGEYKVETNVEAVLTPVDSNGTVGSTETFPVPELTYEVKGGGSTTEHLMTVIVEGKGNVVVKDVQTVGANDTEVVEIPFGVEKQKFEMEAADGWKLDKVEVTINGKTENLGDVDKYEMDESLIDGAVLKAVFVKDNDGGSGGGGSHRPNNKPDETPEALNGDDHFDYVVGYSDGLVHPERNITRAEVASIFFRLLQDDVREKNLTDQNPFNDVFTDDWFNVAVSTMYDMDIVYGRDNNNFDPNAYITRAEFAAIAARFDSEGYSGENLFTDIDGHWAANQINRAAEKGWISGYPDGTFGPDRYITRAEAVTMINRVLNRLPESADALHEDMNVFPDNMDTTAWYYLAIQEATSSHEYEKDKDGVYETWTDVLPDRDWAQYLKLN